MALALENDATLRVAENVARLRKHRRLSQQALARKLNTSQAAVARIEGGRANITLGTMERLVAALRGRLQLSMSPAEVHLPILPSWWELMAANVEARAPYTCKLVIRADDPIRVGAGWVLNEATTTFHLDPARLIRAGDGEIQVS